MGAKAAVRLELRSKKQLSALVDALLPELNRHVGTRSKVKLATDGQFLMLNVEAGDTVALRAALNAYLRWINSTLNILKIVEQKS